MDIDPMEKFRRGGAPCGVKNGLAKLSPEAVQLIKCFMELHPTTRRSNSPHFGANDFIARWYGVSGTTIRNIVKGKIWKEEQDANTLVATD